MPSRCVAVASEDPYILTDVLRPQVNLAIWHRTLPAAFGGPTLRRLLGHAPFTATAEGSPAAAVGRLAKQLPDRLPRVLRHDIVDLAAAFDMISRSHGTVRLRLEAVVDHGCWRWHADAIGLRLLCTYCGQGTEWLPLEGGGTAAMALRARTPPCSPNSVGTGAVALMKGDGYPNNVGAGCIHRSPTVAGPHEARLLLCVDQIGWDLDA